MSRREATEKLIAILDSEARQLDDVRRAMAQRRGAFVAVRPSEIEQDLRPLEGGARRCQQLAADRDALVAELAAELGLSTPFGLKRLLPHLAAAERRRLQAAAKRAAAAAGALRVESLVGERLLAFGRRCNEALLAPLCFPEPTGARTYDRCARTIAAGEAGGILVTGVV